MKHLKRFKAVVPKKYSMEDVMWCLVDVFDEFGMTQKENLNIVWHRSNEAYCYQERFIEPFEYNIWRYNRKNEIIIICPLEQDGYKVWHNISTYMSESKRLIKDTLNQDVDIQYSVYKIGLIKIELL